MKTVSVHLPFEDVENCRDLAGIASQDGRVIAPGRLLRSANLHHASKQTALTLQEMGLSDIIDLRTNWERAIQPDCRIEDCIEHHIPVVHETTIEKSEGGQVELVEDLADRAVQTMENIYRDLILSPSAIAAWKKLFALLKSHPKELLFHCTQGKDRTGIAAALILHALDVDEQTILDEYLQTNLYLAKEATEDKVLASVLFSKHKALADRDINAYSFADERYYNSAKKAAEEHYGSWKGYLQQAIGLSDQDLEQLKNNYLQ